MITKDKFIKIISTLKYIGSQPAINETLGDCYDYIIELLSEVFKLDKKYSWSYNDLETFITLANCGEESEEYDLTFQGKPIKDASTMYDYLTSLQGDK